jgi:hypothetical protein
MASLLMCDDWERRASTFDAVWRRCARYGVCDSIGGMEYRRVIGEWFAAGCPEPIDDYIRVRANIGPISIVEGD